MLSLVRGGWDLDALGKFFRRRCRRRRRSLLFRQILGKKVDRFSLEGRFFENVLELFSPIAGGSRVE